MKELTEQLKQIQLNILDEFVKICDKHHFRYFALGGTALGSVPHGGFIPWDDDIDVGLSREDFEEFLNVAQAELPSGMFLQTFKTDENYPQCFAKIRVSNTTFIEKTLSNIDINHGVYMDVFPLDGYPEGMARRVAFHVRERVLRIAVGECFLLEGKQEGPLKRLIKGTIRKCIPYKSAVRKLDALYRKYAYRDSVMMGNFGGAWAEKEIMPKAVFGNGVTGTFEGRSIRLPEKTDEYLTRLYGDYMTPPPPEKRIAHHYCTVIDLEKPYTAYRN